MTASPLDVATGLQALARAAQDVATALPAPGQLTAAGAQAGDDQVPAVFPRAVVATALDGRGRVGLLIGDEVARAVEAAPDPDLHAAVQPALDAVAAALGVTLGPTEEVAPAEFSTLLGGAWSVVPLIGEGFACGVAATDGLIERSAAGATATAGAHPTPAPTDVGTQPPSVSASAVTHDPVISQSVTVPESSTRRGPGTATRGIELLHDIDMELTVELGRTRMLVRDLLALAPGDVLELDRAAGSPADLLVGGRLIARGEVVVIDEDFGLRITHIVEPNAG